MIMTYKENPKTKGSGIYAAIPQKGLCPNQCADCFFQSGRSFLEPLDENLPNMPEVEDVLYNVVRVNDGNDSNHQPELVMKAVSLYPMKFYNTAIPKNLEKFDAPVMLTINPALMTDDSFYKVVPIPDNLMAVRIRVNCWNWFKVVIPAVKYYSERKVPVILTFMAYYDTDVKPQYQSDYIFKQRTTNSYNVLKTKVWKTMMEEFWDNPYVYSCSKIEGEKASRACSRCGNCIREYFVTAERMKKGDKIRQ